MTVISEVWTQIAERPVLPAADFSGKTIIVTGANVGLGKEAVKHFVRLHATKVIATVRSAAKADATRPEIEAETNRTGIVDFWELDYSHYDSVRAFCAKVAGLERVDAVVLNAGLATMDFEIFEQDESTITVNVISTAYLMLLLLPTLRKMATKWSIVPTLAVTGSRIHVHAKYRERNDSNSLATLSNPKTANMAGAERYQVSKLLQLLVVREMAERTADKKPFVTINTINPGLCHTDLTRSTRGAVAFIMSTVKTLLAWTAEEGSRTLVHATVAGPKSHGVMLSECKIKNKALAPWVATPEGDKVQKKFWGELTARLESVQPGIMDNL